MDSNQLICIVIMVGWIIGIIRAWKYFSSRAGWLSEKKAANITVKLVLSIALGLVFLFFTLLKWLIKFSAKIARL